jgi:hypothetical protein
LKSLYKTFYDLKHNNSGFGWDALTKQVTAPDDVWDTHIKKCPKAALFRNAPFPLYDELEKLCAHATATGNAAFNASGHGRGRRDSVESDAASKASSSPPDDALASGASSLIGGWSNGEDSGNEHASKKPKNGVSTARPSSVTDDTARAAVPKRVRKTQHEQLGNLNGTLQAMLDKIAEPSVPPPSYAQAAVAIPTAEPDVLTQAIQALQAEGKLSVEEQAVAVDMFIENTKSATAWLAMKPGAVRDLWIHNRIVARASIQQGLH